MLPDAFQCQITDALHKQMMMCNVQTDWVLTFTTDGQLLINNMKLAVNLLQCCSSQTVFLQHIVKQLLSTAQTADNHLDHKLHRTALSHREASLKLHYITIHSTPTPIWGTCMTTPNCTTNTLTFNIYKT